MPRSTGSPSTGYEPEYGARPLRRSIQREVDDRIAELLLDEVLTDGGKVSVEVNDGELELNVS